MVDRLPPFRFGQIVADEYFVGRQTELAAMVTDLRAGVSVVLLAPRRTGKSSLVLRALDQLHEHNVLTAYADLQRTPSKVRFASHLAHAIHDGLLGPGEQALQRATDWFGQLRVRPRITFNDSGKPVFEFTGSAPQVDIDATIERLLEVPEEIAARHNTRSVVVFDEFQEVLDLDPTLPALMRSVFQRQTHVGYVFLGSWSDCSATCSLTDANRSIVWPCPMSLGPIAPDLFGPFLRSRFAAGASQITAEGVSSLLEATGGHPNDTQELADFAWARAVSEKRPGTPATVQGALRDVITAETARFVLIWESLSPAQRRVLSALAATSGNHGVYEQELRDEFQLGDTQIVQKALRRLVQLELVEAVSRGRYRVPDAFFRSWLAQSD